MKGTSRVSRPAVRRPAHGRGGEPGEELVNQHPLLKLQSSVGNRAVSRMVQRLSFENTNWNAATEVSKSGDGANGVVFVKDGTDFPLVAKASKDPPRETLFATLFYNKMGKKKNITTPPTRLASDIERVRIATQIQGKGNWEQVEKELDAERYGHQAEHVWVMGTAKGKAFGSRRENGRFQESPLGSDRTVQLLENPGYARNLGLVTACDLFIGNADRIDAGNLGNWMTDEAGAISLIDNFSALSYQSLTAAAQEAWQQMFMPDLRPSNYETKAAAVYEILRGMVAPEVMAAMERSFTMSAEGRKRAFVQNFAKGMADAKKLILAKLAPTLGKRSRSFKAIVSSGEGGAAAWRILKQRAVMYKNLK